MPTLKQITCRIEKDPSHTPLKEYSTNYGDGLVETFVAIPDDPTAFAIHLTSSGYIAPGLAVFVYIDGVYQCNRNRKGLIPPDGTVTPEFYEIDFTLRQKEERVAKGEFVGRPWRFENLDIATADKTPNVSENVLKNVGTIEVVVRRCQRLESQIQSPGIEKPLVFRPGREKQTKHELGDAEGNIKKVDNGIAVKVDRGWKPSRMPFGRHDGADDEPEPDNFGAAYDGPADHRNHGPNDPNRNDHGRSHGSVRHHGTHHMNELQGHSPVGFGPSYADYLRWTADNLDAAAHDSGNQKQRSSSYYEQYRPRGKERSGRRRARVEDVTTPSSGPRSTRHSISEASTGTSTELEKTRRPRTSVTDQKSPIHSAIDSTSYPSQHAPKQVRCVHFEEEFPGESLRGWPSEQSTSDERPKEFTSYRDRYSSYRRNEADSSLASSGVRRDPIYNPRYAPGAAAPAPQYANVVNLRGGHSKMPGGWDGNDPYESVTANSANPFSPNYATNEQPASPSSQVPQNFPSNNAGLGITDSQVQSSHGFHESFHQPDSKGQPSGSAKIGQSTGYNANGGNGYGPSSSWQADANFNTTPDHDTGDGAFGHMEQNTVWNSQGNAAQAEPWSPVDNGTQAWNRSHGSGSHGSSGSKKQGQRYAQQGTTSTDKKWDSGNNNATSGKTNKVDWKNQANTNAEAGGCEWKNYKANDQTSDGTRSEKNNTNPYDPPAGSDARQNGSTWQFPPAEPAEQTNTKADNWDISSNKNNNNATAAQQPAAHDNASSGGRSHKRSKSSSKHGSSKPAPTSTSTSTTTATSFLHQPGPPSQPHIKSYWAEWTQAPRAPALPTRRGNGSNPGTASEVCAPSEAAYVVPERVAREQQVRQYVHAGKGHSYAHMTQRVEYLDGFGAPYAVFRFKYRSRAMLRQILGRKERGEEGGEGEDEGERKKRLEELSKEELVEKVMREEKRKKQKERREREEKKDGKDEKNETTPFPPAPRSVREGSVKAESVKQWVDNVAAASVKGSGGGSGGDDEVPTCNRCNGNLLGEWWHCDTCDDYDVCCLCVDQGDRCKDESHELEKWKDNVSIGNGVKGDQPTGEKLPGIKKASGSRKDKSGKHHDKHHGKGSDHKKSDKKGENKTGGANTGAPGGSNNGGKGQGSGSGHANAGSGAVNGTNGGDWGGAADVDKIPGW